jgi:hypothetical protein
VTSAASRGGGRRAGRGTGGAGDRGDSRDGCAGLRGGGASAWAQVRAGGDSEGDFQGDRVVDSAGHDALVHRCGLRRTPSVAGGRLWARHAATRPDEDLFGDFFVSAGVRSRPLGAAWCWLVSDRVTELEISFRDFVVVAADSAAHAHDTDMSGSRSSVVTARAGVPVPVVLQGEEHVAFAD